MTRDQRGEFICLLEWQYSVLHKGEEIDSEKDILTHSILDYLYYLQYLPYESIYFPLQALLLNFKIFINITLIICGILSLEVLGIKARNCHLKGQ